MQLAVSFSLLRQTEIAKLELIALDRKLVLHGIIFGLEPVFIVIVVKLTFN